MELLRASMCLGVLNVQRLRKFHHAGGKLHEACFMFRVLCSASRICPSLTGYSRWLRIDWLRVAKLCTVPWPVLNLISKACLNKGDMSLCYRF